jgi:hypothetical protein
VIVIRYNHRRRRYEYDRPGAAWTLTLEAAQRRALAYTFAIWRYY